MPDPYEILGVSRDASAEEIKRVYRNLARQHHPDTSSDPGAEERFKDITQAYEVLSDPEKRQRYDLFGDARGASGFGGFGDFTDLFSSFFGGVSSGGSRGPDRGADVVAEVEVTLEEAAAGIEREVDIRTLSECPDCQGSGAAPGTFPTRCSACGGSGEVRQVRRTVFGNVMTATTCGRCHGSGEEISSPCPRCAGAGRVEVTETLTLSIPPGVDDGAQLRVTGRGQAGVRGGRSGDLYVLIRVSAHDVFRRVGDDLGCEVVLPMSTAALGGQIEVPTLDEPELMDIRPGTQSGEVVTLRGKGMPRLRGRGRGDLVVMLKVETPVHLDAEQEDLLRRFAKLRDEEVAARGFLHKIKDAFQ
ncbi:MAG TPA: molecular chaperone DnaJ [Actinomycetota bacterium]|jgi:molecular chaperone DnaJ|nr:molecular chaperone DnaJ [Actinomycetota bacterium]